MHCYIDRKFIVPGNCGGKSPTHRIGEDGACLDCEYVNSPSIQWDHIDGPMLTLANGKIRWLSLWERFLFRIGLRSVDDLAGRST